MDNAAIPTTIKYPSGNVQDYARYTFDKPEPCENIQKSHESRV